MRKLPAYPLFVKDPYFSIWSDTEKLTERETVFWHGEPKPLYGSIEANGKRYMFLGKRLGFEALTQTGLDVGAFATTYTFSCDLFDLEVEFLSPLPPDNIELASMPVCFLGYNIIPKTTLSAVSITLEIEERICYNTCYDLNRRSDVRGGVMKHEQYESAYFGLRRQMPMSHSGDELGADWGYYYVTGQQSNYYESCGMKYISATDSYNGVERPQSGKILLAFDDLVSIFYYGEWLKGYYFRNGKNITDAIKDGYNSYAEIKAECQAFEQKMVDSAAWLGEDYRLIMFASLRQSMGAHKIVEDSKGRVLFISKESNSDGCVATVDVTYPTSPMFLLYNPELVNGMLRPIFDFARCDAWEYDFAPHDAGIYPYCFGQLYGALNQDNKYNNDIYMVDWHKNESLPMYYLFPKGSNLYSFERQMPIEECGNMLIITLSAYLAGAKSELIDDNFDLLHRWADYLCERGLVPENQLCTDDFAGHMDKNANLSIKSCMGIAAFGKICEIVGKPELSNKYYEQAHKHSAEWVKMCERKEAGTPLALGGDASTFSLKYNLIFDKLFETGLFPKVLMEEEVEVYLSKQNEYGTPLDSRADYTKSDWLVWVSSLTEDVERAKQLIAPIAKFIKESPDRVPFGDWYETKSGTYKMFRNRTVQAGIFMPLLLASKKLSFRN